MIVFDADILSCFGKIQKLNLLRDVFKGRFLMSQSVYNELQKVKNLGFGWIDDVFKSVDIVSLAEEEIGEYK